MAMAVLAERHGSDRASSVAHSLRISLIVILIPFALLTEASPWKRLRTDRFCRLISILLRWLSFSFILGEVSERMRFHNGCLLMPIFLGAALTISGIELSAMPHWLMNFAQLMFGLVLGARYERSFFVRYRMFIPVALLNSFFILVASVIAAAVLAWLFSLPIATMIIATSPGGLAEMTITAQALQISVPLVVAFHLFRG
jgi:uncharacterized protein